MRSYLIYKSPCASIEKREWIGNLRNKTMRMKKANNELEAEIDLMEKEVERLKRVKKKLASIVEKQGQDVGVFMALANENAKINATKKVGVLQMLVLCTRIISYILTYVCTFLLSANGRGNSISNVDNKCPQKRSKRRPFHWRCGTQSTCETIRVH